MNETEEVERRAGGSGDLDRDRLVLRALDRDAVTRLIQSRFAFVYRPMADVVRRAGRLVRILDVALDDRVSDLVLALAAARDLRVGRREIFLGDDRDRVRFVARLAVVLKRQCLTGLDR